MQESSVYLVTITVLVSHLAHSSTQKMEANCTFEKFIESQWTAWLYIPENRHKLNYRCENLKSYTYAGFCVLEHVVRIVTTNEG
jgi:hypothetical protein